MPEIIYNKVNMELELNDAVTNSQESFLSNSDEDENDSE